MPIFLDTGNIDDIRKYHSMGIIRGVTTNPTILRQQKLIKRSADLKSLSLEIADIIHPLPLSLEVMTNDRRAMLDQARQMAAWADNINVKITIHGPQGETENLEVIRELESQHDIRVNVTAMMSAQQCFLAAMAGATYVSLFGGRVNNMGYQASDEIKKLRKLLNDFDLKAKIIVGSTREVLNVTDWLCAGAHIVTVLPQFLDSMIVHPYSKETVQMFLNDAAAMHQEQV